MTGIHGVPCTVAPELAIGTAGGLSSGEVIDNPKWIHLIGRTAQTASFVSAVTSFRFAFSGVSTANVLCVRSPRWFANRQHWAVCPCDDMMRCRPGKMRPANFRPGTHPQNDHVGSVIGRNFQNLLRRQAKLERDLGVVLQRCIQRNQFLQTANPVFDRARPAAELRVVLDDVQQRQTGAERLRQGDRFIHDARRIRAEIGGKENLLEFQLKPCQIPAMRCG